MLIYIYACYSCCTVVYVRHGERRVQAVLQKEPQLDLFPNHRTINERPRQAARRNTLLPRILQHGELHILMLRTKPSLGLSPKLPTKGFP